MTTDEDADLTRNDAEGRLPDDAVVMRYGLSSPDTLHKTALAHHDARGDFAISARSRPGMTAEQLALLEPTQGHAKMRASTVGAFRRAGYDVVPDEPPPGHALIMLPRLPVDDDYVVASATFSEPRNNPARQRWSADA